jgi:hypothetical protein
MGHMTDGVLRRYLDEPAAVSDADRDHLATCSRCDGDLRQAAQDRDIVLTLLDSGASAAENQQSAGILSAVSAGTVNLDGAWSSITSRLASADVVTTGRGGATPVSIDRRRGWSRLRHPVAVALTAGVVVIGGTAAAAAADWFPIFHTEHVAPLSVSMQDVSSLSSLSGLTRLTDYGDLTLPSDSGPAQVPDATTAQRRTGVAPPQVASLPVGVEGKPSYYVIGHKSATFTFSAAKSARAAAVGGAQLPPVPAGLDGATLRIDAGPGTALAWMQRTGTPSLIVARIQAPTAEAQGASLAEVRDYLLSIPGIPANLAAQLRTLASDGTTLPIPIPEDQVKASHATVNGVPATLLELRSGFGAGVVWVSDGRVSAVLGPLTSDDVLAVARDVR